MSCHGRKLSFWKLCHQICIRDKRPKVGMRLSLHKHFIDMYNTLSVCTIIALDIVHPYIHTFHDTGIPIHIDARSANMPANAK